MLRLIRHYLFDAPNNHQWLTDLIGLCEKHWALTYVCLAGLGLACLAGVEWLVTR